MKEMSELEKTAQRLHQKTGNHEIEDLCYLQTYIFHSSQPELRKRAVDIFNSLSEQYRKFAFHNFSYAKNLKLNRKTYTLQLTDN